MPYNPYTKDHNQLQSLIQDKQSKKQKLSDALSWFDAADFDKLKDSFAEAEGSNNGYLRLLSIIEIEIVRLQTQAQENDSLLKARINPFGWFDGNQKTYRRNSKELKTKLVARQEGLEQQEKLIAEINESIDQYKEEIEKYRSFDRVQVGDEVKSLEGELPQLEIELARILELKGKVDIQLRPFMQQINKYKADISFAESTID